jgi:DNA repair ATPase RecN
MKWRVATRLKPFVAFVLPRALAVAVAAAALMYGFYYQPQAHGRALRAQANYKTTVARQLERLQSSAASLQQFAANQQLKPGQAHTLTDDLTRRAEAAKPTKLPAIPGGNANLRTIATDAAFQRLLADSQSELHDYYDFLHHYGASTAALANLMDYDPVQDTADPTAITDNLSAAAEGLQKTRQRLAALPAYPRDNLQPVTALVEQAQKAVADYKKSPHSAADRQAYIDTIQEVQLTLSQNRQDFITGVAFKLHNRLQDTATILQPLTDKLGKT